MITMKSPKNSGKLHVFFPENHNKRVFRKEIFAPTPAERRMIEWAAAEALRA